MLAAFTEVDLEQINYQQDLSLASLETLLACIQRYKSGLSSLMLVAHNPGSEQWKMYEI